MLMLQPDGFAEISPVSASNASKSTRSDVFDEMASEYLSIFEVVKRARAIEYDRLRQFERFLNFYFFSFIKCFDASKEDTDNDNYYMEREWRMLGHLLFGLDAVRRIIIPEDYARRLRKDLPEYTAQVTFANT